MEEKRKRRAQQMRVLVVEDEALNSLDIEQVAERLGAQVIGPAADAATAFRRQFRGLSKYRRR